MKKGNNASLTTQASPMTQDETFSARVLRWYDRHGRKDLPWQHPRNLYRVWISEIMLQQTQVSTVIPYFERFTQRFPDTLPLAQSPQDEVLHLWSGLGYYARARNLHEAARVIRDRYEGQFPTDFESVCSLPGIGRSTAGAILSLALGRRHAILDGNVKRVLARHRLVDGWTGSKKTVSRLWDLAETLTPEHAISQYTQGIMDLGATICRRRNPLCTSCPVSGDCEALQTGRQHELPPPKPRKRLPVRRIVMIMAITAKGEILLERRAPTGIWGGLLSFPEADDLEAAEGWITHQFGTCVTRVHPWSEVSHTFSHFRLRIIPLEVRLARHPSQVRDDERISWYVLDAHRVGLSAPVRTLIHRLQSPSARSLSVPNT